MNSRAQTGDAGEYAVAAEIALRGWSVAMPRRNQEGIDIHAYRGSDHRSIGVHVKTRLPTSKAFRLDRGLMDRAPGVDQWVVLVTLLPPGSRSSFRVVPRHHVTAIMLTYERNLSARGKKWTTPYLGAQEFEGYAEAWELLEHPAAEAPWAMPEWVAEDLSR